MIGDVADAAIVAVAASAAIIIIVADVRDDIGVVGLLQLQIGQLATQLIVTQRQPPPIGVIGFLQSPPRTEVEGRGDVVGRVTGAQIAADFGRRARVVVLVIDALGPGAHGVADLFQRVGLIL